MNKKSPFELEKTQFLFDQSFLENKNDPQELIRVYPYGLSLATDFSRPIMLLKDEKGEITLPVTVSPIEAGVTISQSNRSQAEATPHKFTEALLNSLNIKIEKCIFFEIRGHYQYVKMCMQGHPHLDNIIVRADEVMSLCSQLSIPLYCSRDFVNKSKVLKAEMDGAARGVQLNPHVMDKNHNYVI